jgi:pyridoxine 5-phosphate synthase
MVGIALRTLPNACCLVPEKREERTTEGGLDVAGASHLSGHIVKLKDAGIRVSLFIEAAPRQIEAAARLGADIVELHTGRYCDLALEHDAAATQAELARILAGARLADEAGLEVHAGHGLTYSTVAPIAACSAVVELNIGHFLMGEAMFVGIGEAVRRMLRVMGEARLGARVTGSA